MRVHKNVPVYLVIGIVPLTLFSTRLSDFAHISYHDNIILFYNIPLYILNPKRNPLRYDVMCT